MFLIIIIKQRPQNVESIVCMCLHNIRKLCWIVRRGITNSSLVNDEIWPTWMKSTKSEVANTQAGQPSSSSRRSFSASQIRFDLVCQCDRVYVLFADPKVVYVTTK